MPGGRENSDGGIRDGRVIVKGTLICTKCRKAMTADVCACGSIHCYISIYWMEDHKTFRRDGDGYLLTFEKARDKLAAFNIAIRNHTFKPHEEADQAVQERKFEHQMELWLDQRDEDVEAEDLAPETARVYRSYNDAHWHEFFKGMDVRDIDYPEFEKFKNGLAKKLTKSTRYREPRPLSHKMRQNIMNGLHAFFAWLKTKKIILVMPDFPARKKVAGKVMVALDYEDQAQEFSHIPEEHRDIFTYVADTGLRLAEGCTMRIGDIDWKHKVAVVQRTTSGSKLKENTKTNEKKPIPLSDNAFAIARKHAAGKLKGQYLFINPATGRRYTREYLRRLWRKHTDIEPTLYEATRHSFCTQVGEDPEADLAEQQALMRHADIRSTIGYNHKTILKLRDLVNRRGKVVSIRDTSKEE